MKYCIAVCQGEFKLCVLIPKFWGFFWFFGCFFFNDYETIISFGNLCGGDEIKKFKKKNPKNLAVKFNCLVLNVVVGLCVQILCIKGNNSIILISCSKIVWKASKSFCQIQLVFIY